jgi:hypothetical protein
MAIIALYVKTHRKTGLKYLGKTTSADPCVYKGSGTRWTRHLNKHGDDVDTEIIRWCTPDSIKYWGIYFSNLWNVVEDDNWANLRPEIGDGGFGPEPGEKGRATQKILRETDSEWVEECSKAISLGVQRFYEEGGVGSFTGKKHDINYYNKLKITHQNNKHQQGEKNSQHGTRWINNSGYNTKWSIDNSIPLGWMAGRIMKLPSLPKDEKQKLLSQFIVDK